MTDPSHYRETPLPAGTTWTGDWDEHFGDRIYGTEPAVIGTVAALLTGVQHRSGATVSGVAVRVAGEPTGLGRNLAVIADLTPAQARELADATGSSTSR